MNNNQDSLVKNNMNKVTTDSFPGQVKHLCLTQVGQWVLLWTACHTYEATIRDYKTITTKFQHTLSNIFPHSVGVLLPGQDNAEIPVHNNPAVT